MFWKTVIFAVCIVGVFADNEFKLTDDRKSEIRAGLTALCKKANAEDKLDDVNNAVHAFVDCVTTLVNVDQLKREIEDAKPNGALDEVFKKYCAKTPQLKTCIHTLFDGVSPCLDGSSQQLLGSSKNSTDQFIDFICYKDGDRIALFISEQGPECFQEKVNVIRGCGNKIKDSVPSVEKAKELTVAERCAKFDDLSSCIVLALEGCSTPTPANMAESLLKYVRKGSPCNTELPLKN